MKRNFRLLSATLVIALAPIANAQTAGEVDTQVNTLDATAANRGQTHVAQRIADDFASLAGGRHNALELVEALRNGTPVTLTPRQHGTTGTGTDPGTGSTGTGSTGTGGTGTTATGTTITPPTGHMGWGNVYISLALSKAILANEGIRHPTLDQLNASLTGGTVTKADGTTVTFKGVLELRAQGMGWGQIAHAEGVKLGPVLASMHSGHDHVGALPHEHRHTAGAGDTHHGDDGGDHDKRHDDSHGKRLATASGSTSTTTSDKGHGKGLLTANGAGATAAGGKGHEKGIVTAAGGSSNVTGKGHDKGIVTANGGGSTVVGKGHDKGIVTAAGPGAPTSAGHGTKGITTAAGGGVSAAGITTASSHGGSAGIVTASGAAAGSHGVVTAQGAEGGNGGGHAHHGHGGG